MPWQLDEWNPYENAFERSLIEELKPGVLEVVWGMLDELVKQPLQGNPISFVAGKPIRIVSTPPIESEGKIIPPLRIIYALHEEQKLVQPVLICASDESQEGATLEAKALVGSDAELRRIAETYASRPARTDQHSQGKDRSSG